MVQAAHAGQAHDLRVGQGSNLGWPTFRCVPKASVDALGVVIGDIVAEQAPEMLLVEHDHVIQQFRDGRY